MITYELAKKLKDAGFPQSCNSKIIEEREKSNQVLLRAVGDIEFADKLLETDISVYLPELSELIKECGDGFEALNRENFGTQYINSIQFVCVGRDKFKLNFLVKSYVTPEEAVANLWLALNKDVCRICGDTGVSIIGKNGVELSCVCTVKKECRFGHICTSGCQNDFDCPCQAKHCCALTDDCEGCDDHYVDTIPDDIKKDRQCFEKAWLSSTQEILDNWTDGVTKHKLTWYQRLLERSACFFVGKPKLFNDALMPSEDMTLGEYDKMQKSKFECLHRKIASGEFVPGRSICSQQDNVCEEDHCRCD